MADFGGTLNCVAAQSRQFEQSLFLFFSSYVVFLCWHCGWSCLVLLFSLVGRPAGYAALAAYCAHGAATRYKDAIQWGKGLEKPKCLRCVE